MKQLFAGMLAVCLLLSGCSWMDGSYRSVTPHLQHSSDTQPTVVVAHNYLELRTALEAMVSAGTEASVINVSSFQEENLDYRIEHAIRYVKTSSPIGAYAVDTIEYELGTIGGTAAVAVEVTYLHSRSEIRNIETVTDMEQAKKQIQDALTRYSPSLVLLVEDYEPGDLQQLAEDFAAANPDAVMETPAITAMTYPNAGTTRVLELKFSYQTSRDTLRSMQEQVKRVFDSAFLYVSRNAEESQKFAQLYAFLMERFPEYQIKTSITPAYSLLGHGVGDSKAFALVYAQMCRKAGLDCQSVVGTRNGEPWCWNIIQTDGYYFHVDLLACQSAGRYQELTDAQMGNYVWDYSAYPACTGRPPEPVAAQTQPPEETTAPTEPPVETTAPTGPEAAKEIS